MTFRSFWHGMLTVGIMVILSLTLSGCGEPDRPTVSIQHAAKTGDIEQLKRHVYWGTDVNAWDLKEDGKEYTALHRAAEGGHADAAKLLITKGAEVNAKNQYGITPLYAAAEGGHVAVAELLIAKGADVNAKELHGNTPLHAAAVGGHVDVVKLLIDKGADINAKGKDAYTLLHAVAGGGHVDVVKLLIANGADVNAKGQYGYTPLHQAALGGHVDVVKLLIANGADVNAKNQYGITPLYWAAYQGHVDVAKLLIAKGAEVNAKSQQGYTPLGIAARYGHEDIVELLKQHLCKGKPTKPQDMIKKDKDPGAIEGATGQESKADRVENSKNNKALSAASADTPPIKTGDTYIIESLYPDNPKLNSTTERKVISVGDGKITVASRNIKSKTGSTRTIRFTPEWNLISSRNPDGSGLDYSPPLKYFEFPLYPGKTWRQMSIEKNIKTGAVREHTLSAIVGDWEDVSVSAGTFRAIKITTQTELIDRTTGQRSTGTDISWYAPNIRRSVKSEVTSQNFQGNQERQLTQMIRYDLK